MKITLLLCIIVYLVNTFTACSSDKNQKQTDNEKEQDKLIIHTSERYTQTPYPDWDSDTTNIQSLSWRQLMDRILPQVIKYADSEADSVTFFNNAMALRYPDVEALYVSEEGVDNSYPSIFSYADEPEILFITKAIDKKNTFAIMYTSNNEVYFFKLHQKQWKQIGHRKVSYQMTMGRIYLEEFNGESGLEIVLSTYPPNMNGNSWMELFVYKEKEDKIKFAGTFSTYYAVDLRNMTVQEEYAGSHYMSPHKTVYVWHNDMLVPQKTVTINVPEDWDVNEKRTLEYFENPSLSYYPNEQGMKQILKKEFDLETDYEKEDWYLKYWEIFFEN